MARSTWVKNRANNGYAVDSGGAFRLHAGHNCPRNFGWAWFDYLVEVQTLHTRVERVAGVALAVGKPVSDLPSLIKFAATGPEVGQYLLTELGKVDDAWAKVEGRGMNYDVMPKVASKR